MENIKTKRHSSVPESGEKEIVQEIIINRNSGKRNSRNYEIDNVKKESIINIVELTKERKNNRNSIKVNSRGMEEFVGSLPKSYTYEQHETNKAFNELNNKLDSLNKENKRNSEALTQLIEHVENEMHDSKKNSCSDIEIPEIKIKIPVTPITVKQDEINVIKHPTDVAYEPVADKIKKELIIPTFYKDVKLGLCSRTTWKIIGFGTDIISKILVGASTILSFADGYYKIPSLTFAAGASTTVSLVLSGFSIYAVRQANYRTEEINMTLEKIGVDKLHSNVVDSKDK